LLCWAFVDTVMGILVPYKVTNFLTMRDLRLPPHGKEICAHLGFYTPWLRTSVPILVTSLPHLQRLRSPKQLNFLTLEDGTVRLSRNAGTKLSFYAE
jgi:hypothetical protein